MRILVTGIAGFIGSHVADAFVADGHEVVGLDDLSSGLRANVPAGAELHVLDIREPRVGDVIAALRPDVLCHHAAQIDVRRSVAEPMLDAEINIVGTLRLLEACRRAGTSRVVFASTGGAIYGEQDRHPADERHRTAPVSPYGIAKLAVEHYLNFYAVQHGLDTTSLRYANVYGPRQNPHGEAGVVAIFAERMLRGAPVVIFGDGEQTRDFVYVEDVARANTLAVTHRLVGTYNVGTGIETSITELCAQLRAHVPGDPPTYGPAQPGEQRRSSIDGGKLAAATGWRPTTSLADGLARTIAWFSARSATSAAREA